jgi:hypothetical protein
MEESAVSTQPSALKTMFSRFFIHPENIFESAFIIEMH